MGQHLSTVDAVQRDLDAIGRRDKDLARSGLAASALALAQGLDDPKNSLTSKAQAAKSLREALDRLRELAPEQEKRDKVDQIGSGRKARRAKAKG